MTEVSYYLRDINHALVEAWSRQFEGVPRVEIARGDIFGVPADAVVSPANSFGFMDGGIDLLYSLRFGWQLQERLQSLLHDEYDGELPVGNAVIVGTGDVKLPYLISAPTMRVPERIDKTVNAFLAFRAALIAIREHNKVYGDIKRVICPGLGTATGRMPEEMCAAQMRSAYARIVERRSPCLEDVPAILQDHERLRKM